MKIAVSFLSSDNYKKCVEKINNTSADMLHVDVMDGKYCGVRNFTPGELSKLLVTSTKVLDIHLMVSDPMKYIENLLLLDVNCITIHHNTKDVIKCLEYIRNMGLRAGIAINPDEDISILNNYLDYIDNILIMSVYPGKGGQSFIEDSVNRLNDIYELIGDKSITIGMDGGINGETINILDKNKLSYVVSGSFITGSDDYNMQIDLLR